ncbi:MAG TPA: hypothetical protein VKQ36_10380 [Ktedonobacterales bacterium]|nr:hypothetical protein [Ktedonobacterales bacterium]
MRQESYLAIVYRYRDRYVAECPAVGNEGEGETPDAALSALSRRTAEYLAAGGKRLGDGQVVLTQITVAAPNQARQAEQPTQTYTFTGLVWREEDSYVVESPAVGVTCLGETAQEALDLVAEAAASVLEDQPAPSEDITIRVESITVSVPEGADAVKAS